MTAITPLTTGYHEITPLTTKSERCYNQPPLYNIYHIFNKLLDAVDFFAFFLFEVAKTSATRRLPNFLSTAQICIRSICLNANLLPMLPFIVSERAQNGCEKLIFIGLL